MRSSRIAVVTRVAMTSWICSRSGPNTASEPGVLVGDGRVLLLEIHASGQRSHSASKLLESGAGKPDLKVMKRNAAIGVSRADEGVGQCCDLHWVSSIVVKGIVPARAWERIGDGDGRPSVVARIRRLKETCPAFRAASASMLVPTYVNG